MRSFYGAAKDGRVEHVRQDPKGGQQPPATDRLKLAPLGECHVDPTSEQVALIPLALPVAEENECSGSRCRWRPGGSGLVLGFWGF